MANFAYIKACRATKLGYQGNPTPKFVLMALITYMNPEGRCYPSVLKLAEAVEVHRTTLGRTLQLLAKDGWIKKMTPADDPSCQLKYWFILPPLKSVKTVNGIRYYLDRFEVKDRNAISSSNEGGENSTNVEHVHTRDIDCASTQHEMCSYTHPTPLIDHSNSTSNSSHNSSNSSQFINPSNSPSNSKTRLGDERGIDGNRIVDPGQYSHYLAQNSQKTASPEHRARYMDAIRRDLGVSSPSC